MMESVEKLINTIEALSSPKLRKNFEECENHSEFMLWEKNLEKDFHLLLEVLGTVDLSDKGKAHGLSHLVIFFYELQCGNQWIEVKDYSKKLNESFVILYQVSLEELFLRETKFEAQKVFDACFFQLHKKLTCSEFKKYPVLIEVYFTILENNNNIQVEPVSVFPVSLLLIDDCVTSNKVKGLKCCINITKRLSPKSFATSNYYEVVYECLKKVIMDRDIEVTKFWNIAIMEFLRILPSNVQVIKALDVYSSILEHLNIESNLYRKAELLDCAQKIIQILGVDCVKKKSIKNILCDNIDMCCTDGVGEILIWKCLECLEEWIKYWWCIWSFKKDYKMLSKLIKYLCICKDKTVEETVVKLIITLISISSKEEQSLKKKFVESLEKCTCLKNSHKEAIKNALKL